MCAPTVLESLCEKLGRREFLKWSGAAAVAAAASGGPARILAVW